MKKCVVDGIEYVATKPYEEEPDCYGCAGNFSRDTCLKLDSCFEEDNDGVEIIWVESVNEG